MQRILNDVQNYNVAILNPILDPSTWLPKSISRYVNNRRLINRIKSVAIKSNILIQISCIDNKIVINSKLKSQKVSTEKRLEDSKEVEVEVQKNTYENGIVDYYFIQEIVDNYFIQLSSKTHFYGNRQFINGAILKGLFDKKTRQFSRLIEEEEETQSDDENQTDRAYVALKKTFESLDPITAEFQEIKKIIKYTSSETLIPRIYLYFKNFNRKANSPKDDKIRKFILFNVHPDRVHPDKPIDKKCATAIFAFLNEILPQDSSN